MVRSSGMAVAICTCYRAAPIAGMSADVQGVRSHGPVVVGRGIAHAHTRRSTRAMAAYEDNVRGALCDGLRVTVGGKVEFDQSTSASFTSPPLALMALITMRRTSAKNCFEGGSITMSGTGTASS